VLHPVLLPGIRYLVFKYQDFTVNLNIKLKNCAVQLNKLVVGILFRNARQTLKSHSLFFLFLGTLVSWCK